MSYLLRLFTSSSSSNGTGAAQTLSGPSHPYYPQDVEIPNYVPNASSVAELAVRFGVLLAIPVLTAIWIATKFSPRLRLSDRFVLGWFVLCKSGLSLAFGGGEFGYVRGFPFRLGVDPV